MTTFAVETLVMILILFLVIRKWPWPALKKMMTARQDEIGKALASAESARSDAASAEAQRLVALEQGEALAAEILAQATRNAEQVVAESANKATADYERIVTSAAAEVVLERQRAIEEAATLLGDIVMDVVEQVISREVDAQVHEGLISEAVTAIDHSSAQGAAR